MFSLKNKICVVTGASSGIGFAVSEGFAQQGATVVMVYNSTPIDEKVAKLREQYNVAVESVQCNLTSPESISQLFDSVISKYQRIDVFVANAGVSWDAGAITNFKDLGELTSTYDKFMNINLSSVYYCSALLGKIFEKQKHGNLILTASMSGIVVNTPQQQAAYNASKAAVIQLGNSLAVEWAPWGCRVNCVSPGYVKTRLTDSIDPGLEQNWVGKIPLARMASAAEMVGAYVYLASDASSYTTGSNLVVDGGYSTV